MREKGKGSIETLKQFGVRPPIINKSPARWSDWAGLLPGGERPSRSGRGIYLYAYDRWISQGRWLARIPWVTHNRWLRFPRVGFSLFMARLGLVGYSHQAARSNEMGCTISLANLLSQLPSSPCPSKHHKAGRR